MEVVRRRCGDGVGGAATAKVRLRSRWCGDGVGGAAASEVRLRRRGCCLGAGAAAASEGSGVGEGGVDRSEEAEGSLGFETREFGR